VVRQNNGAPLALQLKNFVSYSNTWG
jgi:hypothetical protein